MGIQRKGVVKDEIQYKTTAISQGGRNGNVSVENSPLKFDMALPTEMGGTGKTGVNPEQLFAAGYSACFGSAMQHVVRVRKLPIPAPEVQVTVGIGKNEAGQNILAVDIVATITGVDQALADTLVQEAHAICPYSNATRGNIDVTVTAKVK
jgi:lipoyl-dependent peroxiredoxin